MTPRRLPLIAAALSAALLTIAGAQLASASPLPEAEVRIQGPAAEGPRGTILGEVWARCAPGLVATSFTIQISQGDVITPPTQESVPTCTGDLQPQPFTSLEAFDPGQATVVATLELADAATGASRGSVTRTKQIWVRPAARILLPRTARLLTDRVVELVVRARCDRPWVPGDFLVSATQGSGVGAAHDSAFLSYGCDGDYHRHVVRLQSVASPDRRAFREGWMRVSADLSMFDPEYFDPVTTATASRAVWVSR